MSEKALKTIESYVRARFPVLGISTYEESRVISGLVTTFTTGYYSHARFFVWDLATGLSELHNDGMNWVSKSVAAKDIAPDNETDGSEILSLNMLFQAVTEIPFDTKNKENQVLMLFLIKDAHGLLNKDSIDGMRDRRMLRNIIGRITTMKRCLIFLSTDFQIPPDLSKEIVGLDYPLPTRQELMAMLDTESNRPAIADRVKVDLADGNADRIVDAMTGLTYTEAYNALYYAIVTKGELSPAIVPVLLTQKEQIVKQSKLEYFHPDVTDDDVGDLDLLKAYVVVVRSAFTQEARNAGVPRPRGTIVVGPPGVGKSLMAKVMGGGVMPILRMDLANMLGKYYGDSEGALRQALKVAEAVAPCVSGDTLVALADGSQVRIDTLYEAFHERGARFDVRCWNEQTMRVDTTAVQLVTRRESETWKITAAQGYSLRATANHQHYVMRGGMPEWVRTDELQPGDMLAVPVDIYTGNSDTTRFWPEGMRSVSGQLRRGGGGYRDQATQKLPERWNPALGWMLGAMEGDGWLGPKDAGFVNSDEKLLDTFYTATMGCFGMSLTRYAQEQSDRTQNLVGLSASPVFKQVYKYRIAEKIAVEFLVNARRAILTAPVQARAAFLAGWIDADGCIEPDRITLTIKSPEKKDARQALARALFQSLGVVSGAFDKQGNLTIAGQRVAKLASLLGPYLRTKGDKARALAVSAAGFDRGMGFKVGTVLEKARRASGVAHKHIPVSSSLNWSYERNERPVSDRHMATLVDLYDDQALRQLQGAECRWVTIETIHDNGAETVYDLACTGPHTHSFFANGIVSHNCVLWLDEIEKAIGSGSGGVDGREVEQRMLAQLLTWMQESTAPVYIFATSNDVRGLNEALISRFDEVFSADLPDLIGRKDIYAKLLRRSGLDAADFDLDMLAEATELFSGREMLKSITKAQLLAYSAKASAVSTDWILQAASTIKPVAAMRADDIQAIIDWGRQWATPASTPRSVPELIVRQAASRTSRTAALTGFGGDDRSGPDM